VQLRLLRQRVVMTTQKVQADVLLNRRLHYALPGWDAVAEMCDAQGEFHRQRSPGKGVGGRRLRCGPRLWPRRSGPLGPLEPGARSQRGGCGGCARALAVYKPPPPTLFVFATDGCYCRDLGRLTGLVCQVPGVQTETAAATAPTAASAAMITAATTTATAAAASSTTTQAAPTPTPTAAHAVAPAKQPRASTNHTGLHAAVE
jgi:hypothetical protein